ncbi:ribonuclease H-like domain-containing protein, partial [Mycena leptocephala]
VALKVNMKMGGANPGSVKGTPSIAAVVASVDRSYAQYPAKVCVMHHASINSSDAPQMVTNLAKMTIERLTLCRNINKGVLPQRILVYRNGISEGQFSTLVAEELPAIRKACRSFPSYTPQITIVFSLGKRHHTHFYPAEAANAGPDGN